MKMKLDKFEKMVIFYLTLAFLGIIAWWFDRCPDWYFGCLTLLFIITELIFYFAKR